MDRTLGNLSSMSSVEAVHDIRTQLGQKGGASLSRLALAFKANDNNGSGSFNFQEFTEILGKAGVFLNRQALSKFYRLFDHNQNEQVDYREIMRAIQGEFNERRKAIVAAAWEKVSGGAESVPLEQVLGSFDASGHYRVLSGEKTEQQIFREAVDAFENAGVGARNVVSQQDFEDFHGSESCGNPYNDDKFVEFVSRSWGVSEPEGDAGSEQLITKVRNVLREKVRQRTPSPYGSESETLRKAFRFAGTGAYLTPKQFEAGLRVFGLVLDPKVNEALFARFDAGNGQFNYNEFVASVYEEAGLAASFAAKTQLAQEQAGTRQYVETGSMLLSTQEAPAPTAHAVTPTAILVIGGPETGKSEQSALLANEFGYVHLSPNALVDAAVADADSKVGRMISAATKAGDNVPAELVVGLLRSEMQSYVEEGKLYFVVEGFPRNLEYKAAWDSAMGDVDVPFVVLLDLAREVALQRASDSKAAEAAIDLFEKETFPVLDEFAKAGLVRAVNAVGSQEHVFREVSKLVADVPVAVAL